MKTLEELTKPFNLVELNNKFQKYYSSGFLEKVELDDIPECAMDLFEGYSRLLILPELYVPRNFDNSIVLHHDTGDRSYIVSQIKKLDDENTESLLYLADINREDELSGKISLILNMTNEDIHFKNKPRVGYNETYTNMRCGLGMRRLRVLNALSMAIYNLPLHSSDGLNENSLPLWEKMVSIGEAIKYYEGSNDRFRFKKFRRS